MATPKYVKFQRGKVESYNRLSTKDNDTLYFVYENNDDSKGKLYLGNRLISSVGEGDLVTSLADLTDVIINEAPAGSFLVKNSLGKWVATSAQEIAEIILTAGNSIVKIDENEFHFNSIDGNLELRGFSNATSGMVPVKEDNKLLWTSLPPNLSSEVTNLQTIVNSISNELQAVDGKIATAINNSEHLKYKVINNISEAIRDNIIYLIPKVDSEIDNVYDEYMFVNGKLELIGSINNINLEDYVTVDTFNQSLSFKADESTVANLSSVVSDLQANLNNYVLTTTFNSVVGDLSSLTTYNNLSPNTTISDTIIDIYQRLTWKEISG